MTIKEIAGQLHKMSGGRVNGEKFTKRELENVFQMWMRNSTRYIGSIALDDGGWLFSLDHFGDKADQYDYTIPDTREQEAKLMYKDLMLA